MTHTETCSECPVKDRETRPMGNWHLSRPLRMSGCSLALQNILGEGREEARKGTLRHQEGKQTEKVARAGWRRLGVKTLDSTPRTVKSH